MSKFKPGDRVSLEFFGKKYKAIIYDYTLSCPPDYIVAIEGIGRGLANEEDLRRLKKKSDSSASEKRPSPSGDKPLEIWANVYEDGSLFFFKNLEVAKKHKDFVIGKFDGVAVVRTALFREVVEDGEK